MIGYFLIKGGDPGLLGPIGIFPCWFFQPHLPPHLPHLGPNLPHFGPNLPHFGIPQYMRIPPSKDLYKRVLLSIYCI